MKLTPEPGRIEALDVLRGFALLGILTVNAAAFALPAAWSRAPIVHPPAAGWDTVAWALVAVLFTAKFYTLFSMLFGVSIYLVGGERSDRAAGSRLRRRLFWLSVFGVIHGAAIWYGDILLTYALAGLLVMLARSWSASVLIVAGVGLHCAFGLLALASVGAPGVAYDIGSERLSATAALAVVGGFRGGFSDSLQANANEWSRLVTAAYLPAALALAPLMLVGLGLFKSGVLTGRAPRLVHAGLIVAGLAFLLVQAWLTAEVVRSGFAPQVNAVADLTNVLGAPLATLAYVSLLVLAVRAGGGLVTRALAPVGRMAFTNYLTQSLLMTMLFYGGRGPGLYATLNHVQLWAVVAAIWALQLAWSPLWLSRFQYGPFEWLWRSLTLRRPVPFRN